MRIWFVVWAIYAMRVEYIKLLSHVVASCRILVGKTSCSASCFAAGRRRSAAAS
uniref:Uncharacterized protein n=1 Tax=Setaria viridis TaxID=4556 RepID=A0A4U6U3E0_SETVI|nr:hypothetical protein SEVIR_7G334850v2 [Setaria viridis]